MEPRFRPLPRQTRVYHNVQARRCAYAAGGQGRYVVRFESSDYNVIGVYFAKGYDGQRTLCYVLRSVDGVSPGLRAWNVEP